MRFMVIVKANDQSEAGRLPTAEQLSEMQQFNQGLAESGGLLYAEGLLPSSTGARLRFSAGTPMVIHGPFASTRELVSGFWIVKADSLHEAIEAMKHAPFDPGAEIEIRQIAEASDFGAAMTPELQANEARLTSRMAENLD